MHSETKAKDSSGKMRMIIVKRVLHCILLGAKSGGKEKGTEESAVQLKLHLAVASLIRSYQVREYVHIISTVILVEFRMPMSQLRHSIIRLGKSFFMFYIHVFSRFVYIIVI